MRRLPTIGYTPLHIEARFLKYTSGSWPGLSEPLKYNTVWSIVYEHEETVCVCTEHDMSLLSLSPPLSVSVSRRLLCSYLRVRYEDIASSADSTVKHVYEWSGLGPVPSRVALWVNENTRLTDCDDQGM